MNRPPERHVRTASKDSAGDQVGPPARPSVVGAGSRGWFATRAPSLRFLAAFGFLLGGFYAVILLPTSDRVFYQCLCINARAANAILHALGQPTSVSGVTIRSAQYAVAIRRGCDAIEPAWFFCAAVLSFPGRWRRKPAGLAAGVAAIFALNLVRIVSLYFIGLHMQWLFPTAHLELWPAAFILASLGFWIAWIRWSQDDNRPPSHATP